MNVKPQDRQWNGPDVLLRQRRVMLERGPRLYRHALADDLAVSGRAATIDARIAVQTDKVADLSTQIADLDAARTIRGARHRQPANRRGHQRAGDSSITPP